MMVDMKEVIEKEKDTFSKRFKSRVYMCIYIYICMYVCMYVYIYLVMVVGSSIELRPCV